MVQEVSFRISFWFRIAFEDGKEENTLTKTGHSYLMISNESIEMSELCPSSQ